MGRVPTNISYDEQAIPQVNSEAIDFRVASEQFKSIKKFKESDLESLDLTANY
jgi:hypothetical protein